MKLTGNTMLVTGGGSGIGEALAQRFHDLGNTVIVAGRRREALETAIAGRKNMHALELDVSEPAALGKVMEGLLARFPELNVLFNNAGMMAYEPIDSARDLTAAAATIETNLMGPIRVTDALVDHLKGRPDAVLVNVTSGLAFTPLVDAAVYSATKAAMHSYTLSLREALAGKVEVIELAPPGVQTHLTPGQSTRPGYMPLEDYADEVMQIFQQEPTPREVLVEKVKGLRFAEQENRFDDAFRMINETARKARAAQAA